MNAQEMMQKKEDLLIKIEVMIWKYLHVTTNLCSEEQATEDARLIRDSIETQLNTSEVIGKARKTLAK